MRYIIYLGDKCNLDCKYCLRVQDKDRDISLSLLALIKKDPAASISFRGGEPTLYMDKIATLVSIFPNVPFTIMTNGVDLDKYLPFINEHKIRLQLSYDGLNDLRGFDPFTKPINYWRPSIEVSSILCKGCTNLLENVLAFEHKSMIVQRHLIYSPVLIDVTNNKSAKYALDKDDIASLSAQYKYLLETMGNLAAKADCLYYPLLGIYNYFKDRMSTHFKIGETFCSNSIVSRIDMAGNAFMCTYVRDIAKEDGEKYMREHRPDCCCCQVYDMCGGGCLKTVEHHIECGFFKPMFTWFRDEFFPRYGATIESVIDKTCIRTGKDWWH